MAENIKPDLSAPIDGQIALSAFNNGDGTWAVKRGPTGEVLQDGLPREKALAIVGAPTGPYNPADDREAAVGEERAKLEQKAAVSVEDAEQKDAPGQKTGAQLVSGMAKPDPAAGARKGAANTENGKAGNGG